VKEDLLSEGLIAISKKYPLYTFYANENANNNRTERGKSTTN
jgi:hypothetical protein